MRHKNLPVTLALLIAAIGSAPTAAQAQSVDPQFCGRTDITDAAVKLTRDWSQRYNLQWVEQTTLGGWAVNYSAVRATSSEVICRMTIRSQTPRVPSQIFELRGVDFRYSQSDGSVTPVTLPMSGFDARTAILATWERVFVDNRSFRSMLEARAEQDPSMAATIAQIVGRPAGSENVTWDPAAFCSKVSVNAARDAIIRWAEANNQDRDTGITAKELPRWLPASDWTIANLKVVSSIPFQSAVCAIDISYTARQFSGGTLQMQIRGMPLKVSGGSDGSPILVETHNWPNEAESKDGNNAFNRAWVVNGRTFEQDVAAKQQQQKAQGSPKSALEMLTEQQAAYNQQAEAYARRQGIPVDKIKAAEDAKTRKYAEPCRQHGGTWGYPTRNGTTTGALGCYFPRGGQ